MGLLINYIAKQVGLSLQWVPFGIPLQPLTLVFPLTLASAVIRFQRLNKALQALRPAICEREKPASPPGSPRQSPEQL